MGNITGSKGNSMDCFFTPKGVAVIGATANRKKGGNIIVTNLMRGYTGKIYPVNPRYDEIEGLKCYQIGRAHV